ncbi:hypothetical protein SYNPS1DRAFT_26985 [Syncephalis pseudoplumigaleata]|uniref:Uncharacterized protein n=1 Tax=Syncephalis pseudoplumigaleata TaxID=1712513 RepID=A0A4P9Z468_9FUNG|nr:hypothetical protein SYNPS1DRAFT_26985 [Syncephalis pseudoplumigaleata]|eukprot:RKP27354.1 hypothetical protein SYNPS1DRAFT_26985 [Syncephalis pseudoplumigaleata]
MPIHAMSTNTPYSSLSSPGRSGEQSVHASLSAAAALLPEPAVPFGRTGVPLRVVRDDIALLVGEFAKLLAEPLEALSIAVKEDIRYALHRLRVEDAWDVVAVQTPPQWLGHRPEQDDVLQWEHLLQEEMRHREQQQQQQQQQPVMDALPVNALREISDLDKAYTDAKLDMANVTGLRAQSRERNAAIEDMLQLARMSPQTLDGRRMVFELQKWAGHRNAHEAHRPGGAP